MYHGNQPISSSMQSHLPVLIRALVMLAAKPTQAGWYTKSPPGCFRSFPRSPPSWICKESPVGSILNQISEQP